MDRERISNAMKTLTPREPEVMNCVVSSLLNKEIASELGITERTVKAHRGRAMAKMGAQSSAELIKMLLTIQLNGKEQKANVQSMMSPEKRGCPEDHRRLAANDSRSVSRTSGFLALPAR